MTTVRRLRDFVISDVWTAGGGGTMIFLFAIFLFDLAIRLLNLALLPGGDAHFSESDSLGYWALGTGLANPDTFFPTLIAMTDRMPLYPLLLGGVQSLFGSNSAWVVALGQAIIDAGTCALIASLGALLSPRVGLVAGILAALSVNLVIYSTQVLTDCLALFFFTLMLVAGTRFLLRPTNRLAIVAGLAGGLATLTRPVFFLMLLTIPFVIALAIGLRQKLSTALAAALLFSLGAAMTIAPVLIRNVVYYGTFSLTSQTGQHLAYWIVPLVTQRADGTPYQASVDRMRTIYQQRATEVGLGGGGNPFQVAALEARLAKEEMTRLPAWAFLDAWLEGAVLSLASPAILMDPRVRSLPKPSFYNVPGQTLWQRTHSYIFDDFSRYQVMLIFGLVATVPLLALQVAGFLMLARTLPWAAGLAGAVLAYFLLINGPVAMPKYRLPMEPVLIVLTAIPLAWLTKARRVNAFAPDAKAEKTFST
ncbi:MAG: Dolichyl-phosphate-mannose-protein mannosyltransferase [Alphaproteobacteria bacterium]|nr:Dolichyl-phosphate-mannose-protein mannosyltransferase [Alphaproteobacteria bacterium]